MKNKYFIKGMTCGGCQATVEKELAKVDGVDQVEVDLNNQTAEITSKQEIPFSRLEQALESTHYSIYKDQTKAQQETYFVDGMSCAGCEETVRDRLSAIDGVDKIDIHLKDKAVSLIKTKPVSFAKLSNALDGTHYHLYKTKEALEEKKT